MKLNLFLTALLSLGMSVVAGAQENAGRVVVNPTTNNPLVLNATPDDTYFTVSLENSDMIYNGYQMDIHLPAGMVFDKVEMAPPTAGATNTINTIYPYTATPLNIPGFTYYTYSYSHEISHLLRSDNTLAIVCISMQSTNFTAKNGELLKVYVKASPYMKPGDVNISIDNVVMNHNVWNAEKEMYDAVSYYPSESCGGTITGVSGECSNVPFNVSPTAHWGTCILPFDVPTLPGDVKAYTSTTYDTENIYLTEATSLDAYTPYILYSEAGHSGTVSGTVDPEKYPAEGFATAGNLKGAIAPQSITSGYVLQNLSDDVRFYPVNGTFNIPAGRCWMDIPADANARKIMINEANGISNIRVKGNGAPEAIYNLQGIRVNNTTEGHLFIKGGKKFLAK